MPAKMDTPAELAVVYDNNPYDDRLHTAWGFACVVRLGCNTILFDTGGDSDNLLYNMQQLSIDPEEIDVVFLSHIDDDHTGGLSGFLEKNNDVTIYLPQSFPPEFKQGITSAGAKVEEIGAAKEILPGVFTTGELFSEPKEQALVLNTTQGMVVITGCTHPGIMQTIVRAKEVIPGHEGISLAIGGFHLVWSSIPEIKTFIDCLRRQEARRAAPCHCSGDQARQLFKENYGNDYIEAGVGIKIELPALVTGK
jgi:7,8-dihydropterin-6-yl-methyl-4-(beta-D-ribofuranosyl)aminobenzene 5'-phosphate synthase